MEATTHSVDTVLVPRLDTLELSWQKQFLDEEPLETPLPILHGFRLGPCVSMQRVRGRSFGATETLLIHARSVWLFVYIYGAGTNNTPLKRVTFLFSFF